jgi:hypothetical protein
MNRLQQELSSPVVSDLSILAEASAGGRMLANVGLGTPHGSERLLRSMVHTYVGFLQCGFTF